MELPFYSHTAIITGATGCGKTHLVLDLLVGPQAPYYNYFDVVIVLCPTFVNNSTWNKDYSSTFNKPKTNIGADAHLTHFYWVNPDDPRGASIIDPKKYGSKKINIHDWISILSDQFYNDDNDNPCSILFILDDLAADANIKKKRDELSKLAISGRHTERSLWLLTQKYNALSKDVREQAMWIISFWTKDRKSMRDMIDENYIETGLSYDEIRKELESNNRSYLFIKCFQPVKSTIVK